MRDKAIVLAAGKGVRLRRKGGDNMPKVQRMVCGRPLLSYVLNALDFLKQDDIVVVVGYMQETIKKFHGDGYVYATQEEQLGTGHAVLMASDALSHFNGDVIVTCGDMPLVTKSTYLTLLKAHKDSGNDCTILTAESGTPEGYGRIIRSDDGEFQSITEDRDCTEEQRLICEVNSGVYVFKWKKLVPALMGLNAFNDQKEYYLTDAPSLMKLRGDSVAALKLPDIAWQIVGVNTVEQLEIADYTVRVRNMIF